MIRERQIKGPIDTVEFNGKKYAVEYRRRYYGNGNHFTWIEVETEPGKWIDCGDPVQWGPKEICPGRYRMSKSFVRAEVTSFLKSRQFIKDHFLFVHVSN